MKKLFFILFVFISVCSAFAGQLSWDGPNDSTITGYRVYRSLGTSSFNSIGTTAVGVTIFSTVFDTNQVSRFYVVSYNSQNVESVASNTVTNNPVILPPPPTLVYLTYEAESGTLISPMVKTTDTTASGGSYIQTTTDNTGTATYSINIPNSGSYMIWCKVLFVSGGSDSFFVSVDGTEDIFGGAIAGSIVYSPNWMWIKLNSGNGATIPKIFNLTIGNHSLVFRGRESGAKLDKFVITNNMNFIPNDEVSPNPPTNIRVLSVTP